MQSSQFFKSQSLIEHVTCTRMCSCAISTRLLERGGGASKIQVLWLVLTTLQQIKSVGLGKLAQTIKLTSRGHHQLSVISPNLNNVQIRTNPPTPLVKKSDTSQLIFGMITCLRAFYRAGMHNTCIINSLRHSLTETLIWIIGTFY